MPVKGCRRHTAARQWECTRRQRQAEKNKEKKKKTRASLENTHCPARTDLEEIRVQGRREGAQALTTLQRGTSTLPARSRTGSSEQLRPAPPLTACDYRTKSPFFYPALAREP